MERWPALALTTALLGCTPSLQFDQCRNDDDCRNLQEQDLVCLQAACVVRPDPLETPCEEDSECIAAFDENHICGPQSFCANLTSELCTELLRPDDVEPEDIVYIGSVLAVSPPFETAIKPIENAALLAIENFNTVASLDGGKKVGWVGCDSRGDETLAKQAAEHLVENVGVPAIIGPTFSDELIEIANDVTVRDDVFVMSPTATAKSITGLDDDGLVWRTISSDVYQAAAIGDRLALMDPVPSRVLVFAKQDAYGRGLLEDTLPRIEMALPSAAVGTLFYADPLDFDNQQELLGEYALKIEKGLEQNADTVVFLGTSEVRDIILSYLLAIDGSSTPTPRFLVSHGAVPALQEIVEMVAPEFRPVLMPLLEGVSPTVQQTQDPNTFDPFNTRYRVRFSDLDRLSASALGYDAAMVTLFAMAAVDSGKLDGVEIARAVPRLVDPSGTALPFSDGLQFIVTATDLLSSGTGLDIIGVSGRLDFDLVAGEVRTNLLGWDVVPRPGTTDIPELSPNRVYVLDPAAPQGTWMDL